MLTAVTDLTSNDNSQSVASDASPIDRLSARAPEDVGRSPESRGRRVYRAPLPRSVTRTATAWGAQGDHTTGNGYHHHREGAHRCLGLSRWPHPGLTARVVLVAGPAGRGRGLHHGGRYPQARADRQGQQALAQIGSLTRPYVALRRRRVSSWTMSY